MKEKLSNVDGALVSCLHKMLKEGSWAANTKFNLTFSSGVKLSSFFTSSNGIRIAITGTNLIDTLEELRLISGHS